MASKDKNKPSLVTVEHDPVKIASMDILSSTVAINKLHGETSALENKPQRSMVSRPTNGKTTDIDKPRSDRSDRFDYLKLPLGIAAIVVWGIVILLLVVP